MEQKTDAGFAVPVLYEYCEEEGIAYTVRLITNNLLEELAEELLKKASATRTNERK